MSNDAVGSGTVNDGIYVNLHFDIQSKNTFYFIHKGLVNCTVDA